MRLAALNWNRLNDMRVDRCIRDAKEGDHKRDIQGDLVSGALLIRNRTHHWFKFPQAQADIREGRAVPNAAPAIALAGNTLICSPGDDESQVVELRLFGKLYALEPRQQRSRALCVYLPRPSW